TAVRCIVSLPEPMSDEAEFFLTHAPMTENPFSVVSREFSRERRKDQLNRIVLNEQVSQEHLLLETHVPDSTVANLIVAVRWRGGKNGKVLGCFSEIELLG